MIPFRSDHQTHQAARTIVVLAALCILIAGMKLAAGFMMPILLAFFIATISFPITNWLREHRVPRPLAVLITVIVDLAFLAGVILLGIWLVYEVQSKWESKYEQLTWQRLEEAKSSIEKISERLGLDHKGEIEVPADPTDTELVSGKLDELLPTEATVLPESNNVATEPPLEEALKQNASSELADHTQVVDGAPSTDHAAATPNAPAAKPQEKIVISGDVMEDFTSFLQQKVRSGSVLGWAQGVLFSLINFLGTTFIVMLVTVFMLTEARMFGRRFVAISEAQGPNLQRMLSAVKDIQKYLGIKTIISMVTGVLAGVLCWYMGLEFALLWGILAFVLNYIPAIGSVIAGIPPILLSLLNDGDLSNASIIAGGYVVINGFLGNFLEPTLLGRRFGISTVVVILSVLFWGWVWGPIGMLLAVPLTMLVKVALDNSSDFRWVAVAISKGDRGAHLSDVEMIREGVEAHQEKKRQQAVVATEVDENADAKGEAR